MATSGMIAEELTETLKQDAEDALNAAVTQATEADVAYERVVLEGPREFCPHCWQGFRFPNYKNEQWRFLQTFS